MKKAGLIVLACLALSGCRTRKSQEHRSTVDSTVSNIEQSNIEVKGGIYRVNSTSSTLDSNWQIGMRFENFSGVIHPDGRIEGKADRAGILSQGQKKFSSDQATTEGDTTTIKANIAKVGTVTIKKMEYDRQKEVEGTEIPYWVWLILIGGLLFLGYALGSKLKSKLNSF